MSFNAFRADGSDPAGSRSIGFARSDDLQRRALQNVGAALSEAFLSAAAPQVVQPQTESQPAPQPASTSLTPRRSDDRAIFYCRIEGCTRQVDKAGYCYRHFKNSDAEVVKGFDYWFDRLKAFKEYHGHLRINNKTPDKELKTYVKNIRRNYFRNNFNKEGT